MRFMLIFLGILLPSAVNAHGFGHQQVIDLTLPHHLYIFSAAAAVAFSFVLIAVFLRSHEPKIWYRQKEISLPVAALSSIGRTLLGLILLAIMYIGWFGPRNPGASIVPNAIWVMWNIGFVYFTMLIANIWPSIHPLGALSLKGKVAWQKNVGVWPAVFLFVFYRWIENISDHTENPRALATFIAVYLLVTLFGMWRYGTKTWLYNADPFGVFFRLIGLFSIFEKNTLRLPGAGIISARAMHFSEVVFVMVMLGTIAFDGLKETKLWAGLLDATPIAQTCGMIAIIIAMMLVYVFACILSEIFSGREGRHPLPFLEYAFALLPIAIGYEIAHYIFFFLAESQTFLVLLSDPMQTGANFFGTALNTINYDFLSPESLWHIQIIVIVLGHVLSVYSAHVIALQMYQSRGAALKSQVPMLFLMIGYTVFSLWTITLPTVITVQ
jgi:hypothetical protein